MATSTASTKMPARADFSGLMEDFTSPEFYLQLVLIGIAVIIGLLLARLVRRFYEHERQRTGETLPGWLERALSFLLYLQPPVYAIIGVGVLQSLLKNRLPSMEALNAFGTVAFAWLIARLLSRMLRNRYASWFLGALAIGAALLSVAGLLSETLVLLNGLALSFGTITISLLGVLKGVVLFIILLWVAGRIRETADHAFARQTSMDEPTRELLLKIIQLSLYLLAVVLVLPAMGIDLSALAVFGGALGVGIGFGLQRITANFISGLILLFEKSIKPGDLIELDGSSSWVRRLAIRYTLIETFEGKEIIIPNETLVTSQVTNWTHSHSRARVDIFVTLAYTTDVPLALAQMREAAESHPRCLKNPPLLCQVREFSDLGVKCLIAFWVADIREGMFNSRSEVMQDILKRFHELNIEVAQKDGARIPLAGAMRV